MGEDLTSPFQYAAYPVLACGGSHAIRSIETARIRYTSWWRGSGVAAHLTRAAGRTDGARRRAHGVGGNRYQAKGLAFPVHPGAYGVRLGRWPQSADGRSLGWR